MLGGGHCPIYLGTFVQVTGVAGCRSSIIFDRCAPHCSMTFIPATPQGVLKDFQLSLTDQLLHNDSHKNPTEFVLKATSFSGRLRAVYLRLSGRHEVLT